MTRSRRVLSMVAGVLCLALAGCTAGPPSRPAVTAAPPADPMAGLFPQIAAAGPRQLGPTCLTDREIQADLFTRLRTQMMVTGLTCAALLDRPELFTAYQGFLHTHGDVVLLVQQELGWVLSRGRPGSPDRLFDTYVTGLANEESVLAADISPVRYCTLRSDQFQTASRFTAWDLQAYLDEAWRRQVALYPRCAA